jgi:hypothetical protein
MSVAASIIANSLPDLFGKSLTMLRGNIKTFRALSDTRRAQFMIRIKAQ